MEDHPVPTLLYHYTDAQGFRGIVESQTLWATHIQCLNDAEEFDYAVNLAKRVILERAPMAAAPREQALLTRLGTDLNAGGRVYVCVASFSEVDDGLSQWRGYCPNGAGYSIGFVAQDLIRVAGRQGFSLARCLYDDASQTRAITQVLEEVRRSIRWTQALDQPGDDAAYRGAIQAWLDNLAPLAPTIKHRAFHEEQEWRLISESVSPAVRIRSR